MKKQKQLDYVPKVGDVVEVWERETPRHKYRMEFSFVQVLRIVKEEDNGQRFYTVSVKESGSFAKTSRCGYSGSTVFQTRGHNKWDRAFVKIGHMPVKTSNFNPPKRI